MPRQAFERLKGGYLGTLAMYQYATAGTEINSTHSWIELLTPWRFLLASVSRRSKLGARERESEGKWRP